MTPPVEPVRVGVWGVGTWGEKHARVYAGLPSADLVGVFDADAARAERVAARYGTRAFSSAEAMLARCEAVSIAVPTTEHAAAFAQAAAAGRHALVEKPMAATLAEADAMLAAARAARTTLQVGHVERFNPALRAVRPHVQRVKFIEAHRLALFQPRSLDIDVVFDLMIHDLDVVLDVVGLEPAQVSAVGVAVLSANEDIANARLEFEDGCVANLTASRVSQERLRRIRFFQDDAYVSVDLFAKTCDVLRLDAAVLGGGIVHPLQLAAAIRKQQLPIEDAEPLALELDAFVRSLRGSGSGAAPGEAGRGALAVAEAVRAGMKQRALQWASLRPSAS
jgi:predicted dehydrogenase